MSGKRRIRRCAACGHIWKTTPGQACNWCQSNDVFDFQSKSDKAEWTLAEAEHLAKKQERAE